MPAGLLVSLSVLAGVTAIVLPLTLPGEAPVRSTRRAGPAVDNAPYRAYRQVAEQLSWAAVSPRHYDLVTRPLMTRLAAARLADRHRVDLWSDPEQAPGPSSATTSGRGSTRPANPRATASHPAWEPRP